MSYTTQRLKTTLAERLADDRAQLEALKAITIKTTHKALTNRSIEGARLGDYIDIGKALYISYYVENGSGYKQYKSRDITVYTYQNPDGSEIGAEHGLRISRTMTPTEARAELDRIIDGLQESITSIEADYKQADKIAAKYDKLSDQMESFLDGLTWASRGALK